MSERDQNGLTPDFRRALDALPREKESSAELENRTVAALRQRGLIASRWSAPRGRSGWSAWVGIAAALAIFAAGTALGHRLGSSSAVVVLAPAPDGDARETAAFVQRTGSAHAAAIVRLASAVESADPRDVELAREVSLAALRASLEALTRLDPTDPTPSLLLAQVQPVAASGATRGPAEEPWVVWF
jgi:hypothetical protein